MRDERTQSQDEEDTTHTPPPPFNKDTPSHENAPLNQQHCNSEHTEGQDNTRGNKTTQYRIQSEDREHPEEDRDNTNKGHHTHHPAPAIQQDHQVNGRGTPTRDGRDNATAPALPSPCHPPSVIPPTHPRRPHPPPRQGGNGRRIPHHTKEYGQTHTRTHHTPDKNNARHDCSTDEYRTGIGGALATPPDSAG